MVPPTASILATAAEALPPTQFRPNLGAGSPACPASKTGAESEAQHGHFHHLPSSSSPAGWGAGSSPYPAGSNSASASLARCLGICSNTARPSSGRSAWFEPSPGLTCRQQRHSLCAVAPLTVTTGRVTCAHQNGERTLPPCCRPSCTLRGAATHAGDRPRTQSHGQCRLQMRAMLPVLSLVSPLPAKRVAYICAHSS